MSPFRRKRDGDEQTSQDTVEEAPATPDADEPDPAAWALPADAGAVTTDAGTAATDAAATETVVEAEEPAPVAAPTWTPPASSSTSGSDPMETFSEVTEQRPELLVAGAFAGAFLFARILKRITND